MRSTFVAEFILNSFNAKWKRIKRRNGWLMVENNNYSMYCGRYRRYYSVPVVTYVDAQFMEPFCIIYMYVRREKVHTRVHL